MKKFAVIAAAFTFAILSTAAFAQQGDVGFGFGTIMSPGAAQCNSISGCPEKGGLYPNVSVDVIFHKRIGFAYDVTWRGGQGNYGGTGQPYRPIINTFDAIYQPRVGKKVGLDLKAGIGIESVRYYSYQNTTSCIYFNACFNSSDHFLFNVGGGIRYYVWNHVFVRPEVNYYWIHNNTADFSSNNIIHVGATIGYTIGGPE